MQQLEKRFYTRAELIELFGEPDDNFSRTVKTTLNNWGYKFENYTRKGVTITDIPATAHEQLKEIMLRDFNLDVRTNIYAFSCFVYLLMDDEDFSSMPWGERVNSLHEYGVYVDKRTLERWAEKLMQENIVHKDSGDKTNWCTRTSTITGKTIHERVDGNVVLEQEMQQYKDRRKQLLKEGLAKGLVSSILLEEFGCYYYMCGTLVLNAIETDIHKVYELVREISREEEE